MCSKGNQCLFLHEGQQIVPINIKNQEKPAEITAINTEKLTNVSQQLEQLTTKSVAPQKEDIPVPSSPNVIIKVEDFDISPDEPAVEKDPKPKITENSGPKKRKINRNVLGDIGGQQEETSTLSAPPPTSKTVITNTPPINVEKQAKVTASNKSSIATKNAPVKKSTAASAQKTANSSKLSPTTTTPTAPKKSKSVVKRTVDQVSADIQDEPNAKKNKVNDALPSTSATATPAVKKTIDEELAELEKELELNY